MSNRFTERAQRVILVAEEEAKRLNHDYVGTEHILLGMIAIGEGVAAQVLSNLGVDLRMVRQEIEKIVGQGDNVTLLGNIPFTPRAKKVLEFAVEEAVNLGHSHVGTEHLLLGLIREEEGIAAQVMENLGVRIDIVREEINILLGEGPDASVAKTEKKTITLAIDEDPWYTFAEGQEVYNTLNTLAMEIEPILFSGGGITQYKFDENSFFKAEALWAEREGLC